MKTRSPLRHPRASCCWPLLFSFLALTASAPAATRFVTSTSDDPTNNGSLRYAINAAAAGDTIEIKVTGTLVTTSPLAINRTLTINGPTTGTFTIQRSTEAATPAFAVLTFGSTDANLTLRRLKVTNGNGSSGGGLRRAEGAGAVVMEDCQFVSNRSSGDGGGLWFSDGGKVSLRRCAIQDNVASVEGGGIYATIGCQLDIRQCSFTGNSAGTYGGGLRLTTAAVATVVNSTFSGNPKPGTGSAISADSKSKLTLLSSTITQNGNGTTGNHWAIVPGASAGLTKVGGCILAGNRNYDWGGGGTSLGYNLVGRMEGLSFSATGDVKNVTDPKLQPLGTYGGTLLVHPPTLDSYDVVDRGKNFTADYPPLETTDQLGKPRSVRGNGGNFLGPADRTDFSDAGAVELQVQSPQFTGDIVVNSYDDTDDGVANELHCSLREALQVANARPFNQPALILFHPNRFSPTTPRLISLTRALPVITRAITIQGPGAKVLTILRGDSLGNFSIFTIGENQAAADISGLTLRGGSSTLGGGIYVASTGALKLSDCHVTNCRATQGGGGLCCKGGTITIRNCSFWNNRSDANAAAYLQGTGTATITNSTFQGNIAVNGPGTIVSAGTMSLDSCTIVDNYPSGVGTAPASGTVKTRNSIITQNYKDDLDNRVTSLGFNLVNIGNSSFVQGVNGDQKNVEDPKLGPLRNNGGTTYTMALLPGSRAIDKGNAAGLSTDQRGLKRPYDLPGYTSVPGADSADIGAFELQPGSFDLWRLQTFPESQLNLSSASPTGDANRSGVPNSLKYLFGVDPVNSLGAADLQALPQPSRSTEGERSYLTITYRKNTLYDGPQEIVEISTDMKKWLPAEITRSQVTETADEALYRTISVTVDVTGMPKAWLRVYRAD